MSVRFSGIIEFDELMDWHCQLFADNALNRTLDGLSDERAASFRLTPQQLDVILAFNSEAGLSGHWVHLVDTPYETAIAMLYQQKAIQLVHPVSVCSTTSAASGHLGLDVGPFLLT